jgi:carbon-monoxide dehydrogenase large subunit
MMLGAIARLAGRPIRYTESRSESMLGLGHGRAQVQDVEIGGTREGKILAYRLHVLQDAGAYPRFGAYLPTMTKLMLSGTYDIPNSTLSSTAVVTNTVPLVAYRGAGRPEAAAAIERAVDLFAAEIGMDPAEVRRRNVVAADRFPYTNSTGTVYDSGQYEAALDLVLEAAGYTSLRDEQAERRSRGEVVQLGIGLSVYVEVTAGGGGTEYGRVEVGADGRVQVQTGTTPYGQGHRTSWAMLVSERLGIPMDRIDVVHGDTDLVARGSITGGSRSAQLGGTNVWRAAGTVLERARALAAQLLEADPADVVLEDGRFHVAGTPSIGRTWAEVAAAATELDGEPLAALGDFTQTTGTYPSGAHLAVVEVDTETGQVVLRRLVAVDDAGTILNPMIAEGQVHGGLAQGVAQALLEEVVYDADGNPLTANFADYGVISAAELPSFETVHLASPSPANELGAKGIGESGTIGATPAVHNAVIDALSHLGVRHLDMPCTAERVWRAIHA